MFLQILLLISIRLSPLKGATSETAEPATSQKSHGISHVFGEKLRRGMCHFYMKKIDNNLDFFSCFNKRII